MKSIIDNDKTKCFRCGVYCNTEEHHIFERANRKNSEKYGLKVYLCHNCHNRDKKHKSIHFDKEEDLKLKKLGEKKFLEYYNKDIGDFIKIFYINYL